ncbi:ribokinase [Streptomyces sp. GMY02]|uniref:ribokinase n=1 Tax=Streptomyces sp. GMY02 TaxID=1333528 RepID=UPI001C2C3030|nr:ribokinase [Streptomyces sp. GMY02]QXE38713.1 ribokinase [Streptomyces sp. GMY02]
MTHVAVVGSANLDLVAHTPRRPAPGETVLGGAYRQHPGGKGLNQAVAAATLTTTSFVGRRGSDEAGRVLATELVRRGVDTSHFLALEGASGHALITVTPDGENSIVVLPEANHRLLPDDVTRALDTLAPQVVLTQQEIPLATTEATAHWAQTHGARLMLNASPSTTLPGEVLAPADPLVVNLTEAHFLTSADTPSDAAKVFSQRCVSVIITLGSEGSLVVENGRTTHLPAPRLTAVDTTGAGDMFAGVTAAHLALGTGLVEAARQATQAAAKAIQTPRSSR